MSFFKNACVKSLQAFERERGQRCIILRVSQSWELQQGPAFAILVSLPRCPHCCPDPFSKSLSDSAMKSSHASRQVMADYVSRQETKNLTYSTNSLLRFPKILLQGTASGAGLPPHTHSPRPLLCQSLTLLPSQTLVGNVRYHLQFPCNLDIGR